MSHSLRRRAVVGSLIWAAVAFAGAGAVLFQVMDGIVVGRFDRHLGDYFLEFAEAVSRDSQSADAVSLWFNDPEFRRPYSGYYWQAEGPRGEILVSPSLFDFVLVPLPANRAGSEFWNGRGPQGEVRGLTRDVRFESGLSWRLTIAESTESLAAERERIRDSLALAFGFLSALAVIAATVLASLLMRPLEALRKDVAERWDSGNRLEPADYPLEVAPLVSELNDVIDRNAGILERGRRRASDLAHALNTPASILRNEIAALAGAGTDTQRASEALDRIEAQITRSLARMRAENTDASGHNAVPVGESFDRLGRAFRHQQSERKVSLTFESEPGLSAAIDRQDLEEIIGNLVDNAFKWCRSVVTVKGRADQKGIEISVEDDGPGIPEESRREALRAGGRLDRQAPGTGLGLAIVSDLAHAYGGELSLDQSATLGGLAAKVTLPGKSASQS